MPVGWRWFCHTVFECAQKGHWGGHTLDCVLVNCAYHDVGARRSWKKLTVTYTGLDRDQQRASRCCCSRSLPGC